MFSKIQTVVLTLLCLAAAGTGGYLIFFDGYAPSETGAGKPLATLTGESGSVQRKPATSYLWVPAPADTKFFLNDALQTGPESHATLRFADGTTVEVGPDAMLIIDDKLAGKESSKQFGDVRRAPPIRLSGSASDEATPRQSRSGGEATPRQAPESPGKRVVKEDAPPARRSAPVTRPSAPIRRPAELVARAAPPPPPEMPVVSSGLLSLESPSDGEQIGYPAEAGPTKFLFSWEREPAVGKRGLAYRLEIATDRYFSSSVKSIRLRENSVASPRVGLSPGIYYWRVRVVDDQGGSLRTSPVSKFSFGPLRRRRLATMPETAEPPPSLSAPTHLKVHVE